MVPETIFTLPAVAGDRGGQRECAGAVMKQKMINRQGHQGHTKDHMSLSIIPPQALLISIAISLAACSNESRHDIGIQNATNHKLYVTSVSVNDNVVDEEVRSIPQHTGHRYLHLSTVENIEIKNGDTLKLTLRASRDNAQHSSCIIKIESTDGRCLLIASYKGTNKITCWCESYSDFYK